MTHTDPTFRALLLELAERDPPQLDTIGVLADWLEERGDERAAKVRAAPGSITEEDVQRLSAEACSPFITQEILLQQSIDGEARLPPEATVAARLVLQREKASRVLALFPEGPRWYCERYEDTSFANGYLLLSDAARHWAGSTDLGWRLGGPIFSAILDA